MTDSPREFRLSSAAEGLGDLADFLRAASGADVIILVEPVRALGALEAQLLTAATADQAGPATLRVAPDSPRIRSGLRLLGLEDHIEVAA